MLIPLKYGVTAKVYPYPATSASLGILPAGIFCLSFINLLTKNIDALMAVQAHFHRKAMPAQWHGLNKNVSFLPEAQKTLAKDGGFVYSFLRAEVVELVDTLS